MAVGLNNNNSDEPQKEPTSSSATQTPGASESATPSATATSEASSRATSSESPSVAQESEEANDSDTGKTSGTRTEFTAPVIPEEYAQSGEANIFGGTVKEIEKLAKENNLKTS